MLQINDDLVLVPHSYGGFLATLFAARNPRRVGGAVLVDIDHIGFYNDGRPGGPPSTVIERARQEQRLGAVRYLEGRRGTVARMRTVEFPSELRTIDIVSESTPRTSPEDKASWNRAHEEFVKGSPNRKLIVATGSGHYVMRDKPDVVIEAIEEVYAYARTTGNVR
jgi:pimeloyl-ACP methyl ester carboxylesterase